MSEEKAWQILEVLRESAIAIERLEQRVAALELDVSVAEREIRRLKQEKAEA